MSADLVRNKQSVDLFVVFHCLPSTERAPFMLVDGEADRKDILHFISRMVAWLYVLVYIFRSIYEDVFLRRLIALRNLRE